MAADEGGEAQVPLPHPNAATARSFKWSLSNGAKLPIIATDAGLMPVPVRVANFRHSAGERYEVIIDFAAYPRHHHRPAQHLTQEQRGLHAHQQGDALRGHGPAVQHEEQLDPGLAVPGPPGDDGLGDRGRDHPDVRLRPEQRPVDDQRPDLGRRRGQRLQVGPGLPEDRRPWRSGSCATSRADGTTPPTSTSSTSRCSAATASRRCRTNAAARTWSSSVSTRRSRC